MPRLSREDRRRARELEAELRTFVEGEPPALSRLMPRLREYLGTAVAFTYGPRIEAEGCGLSFVHLSGAPVGRAEVATHVDAWLRASGPRPALYTPARVEPFQRNRALVVGSYEQLLERGAGPMVSVDRLALRGPARRQVHDALERLQPTFRALGAHAYHQLRILVCEGELLRAWVGCLQPDPIAPRQRMLLAAVAEPLRRRLRLEDGLGRAPLLSATLDAALEQLSGAAFLLDGRGDIRLANAAGRAQWDADPAATREALLVAMRSDGRRGRFAITAVDAAGAARHFLAVEHAGRDPEPLVTRSAVRYGLTPREQQVLAHLLRGASNGVIALELGCAERTVEVHVRRILAKADAPTRSALVARLWMQG